MTRKIVYNGYNIYGGKNVLFMPNYIIQGLNAQGVSLGLFENILIEATNDERVFELLEDKLSKNDILDFYLVNMYMSNYILGEDDHGSIHDFIKYGILYKYGLAYDAPLLKKRYTDILNNLLSKKSIYMSENDDESKYTLSVQENTIFVILHDGFSDLLFNSDSSEKEIFVKTLINKMFNVFGEEATLKTSIFKAYIRKQLLV